ncbi:hypothetical protein [Leucobacter aridicollis]|uniref:Methionine synthase II (Cobalamin-independent) n=1 Tax=Leucobacter aridicollis TaxID=283878 RepID=A0A852QY24_9MICO|nr:hypothetical protein [Leucobacter aridicollis]MBL3682803.1 hypothetical protein [Leucobacter aridicollis]NYD26241.1 methionine synthase II (cobalamin-independent) [Leucobacter aridicollis]
MSDSQVQGAHLVGSINFDEAAQTMRVAAEELGGLLRRIPDGEVGERFHWILFQADRIGAAEGIERVGDTPIPMRMLDIRPVRLAPGVQAADIVLPPLGYAEAALESWRSFSELKAAGVIPGATRFQVSLPTPLGVVASLVAADDREAFEPVYERALAAELAEIVAAIPAEELAIQWDAALEFAILEGLTAHTGQPYEWFGDVWEETSERLARQIDRVPLAVEVGVHLCYGDVAEKHFVEPRDAANLTRFANAVVAKAERDLTWLHLPVPIERDDAEFFAPLADLSLPETSELYLGLVHREDGAEGATRRIAAASAVLTRDFGVATECGFGRAPEGTTVPLFETHRAVAAAW